MRTIRPSGNAAESAAAALLVSPLASSRAVEPKPVCRMMSKPAPPEEGSMVAAR